VLYDVIVLSQPCYDLFEKMTYMDIKNRRIIGIDLYVDDITKYYFHLEKCGHSYCVP